MTLARGPAAATLRAEGGFLGVNALFGERGWTDGLPIVPPTEPLVRETLSWTDHDPRDVIAILPPRQGEATVEKIAINAVMAGCEPRYLPVVIAAIRAIGDPAANADGFQATTHPCAPLLILNGPIARELGVNSGYNCYGQGTRANATIGRAVRLVLMNVGGGLPGDGDRSSQGSPAKYSYCVAENEDANPWQPLHVERGFAAAVSTVTVIAAEGPHNIQDHYSNTALGVLQTIAGAMGQAGSNNILSHGTPVLTLGPEHAATIAREGLSKADIKQYIYENARYPLAKLSREAVLGFMDRVRDADPDDPNGTRGIVDRPEDILVIVAGGPGKHSSWQPTFGNFVAPVTVPLARADGTPLRAIADARR